MGGGPWRGSGQWEPVRLQIPGLSPQPKGAQVSGAAQPKSASRPPSPADLAGLQLPPTVSLMKEAIAHSPRLPAPWLWHLILPHNGM